ncbi:MAG: Hsp20/alpha crystallin family protein [Candidatus Limnocylindrales bacterium]|jgi:HSP20 family protein
MTLIRRTTAPFGDLLSLRQAMDRLFEESFVNPRTWSWGEHQFVALDVYATEDDLVVEANLPGVKPEEVDITVEGNTLTIAGETRSARKDDEGSTLISEIRRGAFTRALTLPAGLEPDKATATFEDGVLTLRIPKAEQVKPRQIKITSGESQHAQPATVGTK